MVCLTAVRRDAPDISDASEPVLGLPEKILVLEVDRRPRLLENVDAFRLRVSERRAMVVSGAAIPHDLVVNNQIALGREPSGRVDDSAFFVPQLVVVRDHAVGLEETSAPQKKIMLALLVLILWQRIGIVLDGSPRLRVVPTSLSSTEPCWGLGADVVRRRSHNEVHRSIGLDVVFKTAVMQRAASFGENLHLELLECGGRSLGPQ